MDSLTDRNEREPEKGRDGFIFYRSFYEAIHELNFDDQVALFEAICEYQFNQYEPYLENFNSTTKAIWLLIKPQLDANNRRYENGLKRRQTNNKNQTKTKR